MPNPKYSHNSLHALLLAVQSYAMPWVSAPPQASAQGSMTPSTLAVGCVVPRCAALDRVAISMSLPCCLSSRAVLCSGCLHYHRLAPRGTMAPSMPAAGCAVPRWCALQRFAVSMSLPCYLPS